MADVWNLPEPIRYVPAIVPETIERVVWVDEDDAEDIERHDELRELARKYLDEAKGEVPADFGLTIRLVDRWDRHLLPEREQGPVEACPHCGSALHEVDDSPVFAHHDAACPLRRHYVSTERGDTDGTRRATCDCGWKGPERPLEHEPDNRWRPTPEFATQLVLDGRAHLAGRPHSGSVRKDLGMPDLPAEYSSWRPVSSYPVTHLLPAPSAAVSHG